MAVTSTLTQVAAAQMGVPTTFVLAVTNGGASAVTVTSVLPVVRRPDGLPFGACRVGQVAAAGQVGPNSQYNVSVGASSTTYFSFQVSFYGPVIEGSPTQPSMAYVVDCVCAYSDNTSSTSPLEGQINAPAFGEPGTPPDPVPLIGQLNFSSPVNSGLLL